MLFFLSSLVCLIFGLVHFFRGPLDTPLAISLIFMVYNMIPQFLLLQVRAWGLLGGAGRRGGKTAWQGALSMDSLLDTSNRACQHHSPLHTPAPSSHPSSQYVVYRKPLVFNAVCKLAMLLSTAVLILGVVLVWLLYPRSYDYKQVGVGGWGARLSNWEGEKLGEEV